ncbi:oxidoreductase [Polaribacter reichenbachii]|uniref:Oxidoreductase n=1 Tax=Polaribacter reichenbachii TaxID=996801 RepID=A0A1B8U6B3_9FLAO|nr:aldo/keto reductase [Polaribacter reichenbachii]APZ46208.1 oxidoreductase [Polaribacter reichenbachii]AUC20070.1 oxidoreductase [Polaribacter reichenbachii]OBY67382.1 oxidoreductase [Polaribacter reichenbachii]
MSLGLGTAALGRPQYINVRQKNVDNSDLESFKKQSFSVLENAYNLGIRYFDTAPGYGLAEELLLEWLQTKNDNSIQVATKWGYTYTANFNPNAKVHEVKEHSLAKLNEQWQFSKQLLPYLKVYQIHSATLETGVLENTSVLEQLSFLKKEYNLKIGLTTTGTNQTEVIQKALNVLVDGEQLFDVYQVTYNFLDQSLSEIIDELQLQNKSIVIKEALANGRIFRNKKYPHYNKMYTTLENLANKHNVGVDAIALKYCEQTISKSTVLSGASNLNQLKDNLKTNLFSLSNDDIDHLNSFKISPELYWQERKELQWN